MGKGIKHDATKLRWALFPFDVARGVVNVLMYGAAKYDAHNWRKGMAWSRVYEATLRHLDAFWTDRETLDPESQLPHLDHALCELLFLRYYTQRYPKKDDRFLPGIDD